MIDQVNSEPTIGHVVGTSIQNVVFSLKKKRFIWESANIILKTVS